MIQRPLRNGQKRKPCNPRAHDQPLAFGTISYNNRQRPLNIASTRRYTAKNAKTRRYGLSLRAAGRKEGDCVGCGHHGLKYDASGRCIKMPGQHAAQGRSAPLWAAMCQEPLAVCLDGRARASRRWPAARHALLRPRRRTVPAPGAAMLPLAINAALLRFSRLWRDRLQTEASPGRPGGV